jgi:hypothetical protein
MQRRWSANVLTLLAAQAVSLLSAAGCGGSAGAQDGCPELPTCGGDPTGSWQVRAVGGSCQYLPPVTYSVPVLPPPATMLQQTPTPQTAPKSPGDDCFSLVYEPNVLPNSSGPIQLVALPHQQGTVRNGPVNLLPDHEYNVAVQTVSYTTVHFSRACLTAYGANPSCDDLAKALPEFATEPNYQFSETGAATTDPFVCIVGSPDGCDCTYPYESTAADVGTWRVTGNILYFLSEQNVTEPITETTYCSDPVAKTLTITGRDGQSLFSVKGLRSFTFVPATM